MTMVVVNICVPYLPFLFGRLRGEMEHCPRNTQSLDQVSEKVLG